MSALWSISCRLGWIPFPSASHATTNRWDLVWLALPFSGNVLPVASAQTLVSRPAERASGYGYPLACLPGKAHVVFDVSGRFTRAHADWRSCLPLDPAAPSVQQEE